MRFKIIIPMLLMVLSAGLIACSNPDSSNSNTNDPVDQPQEQSDDNDLPGIKSVYTGELSAEQAQALLDSYLKLKDALVLSDLLASSAAARIVVASLEGAPSDETVDGILADARAIGSNGDLEVQRTHFRALSNRVWSVIKAKELNANYFLEYCPMAFGNTGGFWVSSEEVIMNPYFGDAMLHCGSVITDM